MGTEDRRGRIYPHAQNMAYCMGRLFKQRPPAIAPLMLVCSTGFRIFALYLRTSIKETLGKRIDLRYNGNVATVFCQRSFKFRYSQPDNKNAFVSLSSLRCMCKKSYLRLCCNDYNKSPIAKNINEKNNYQFLSYNIKMIWKDPLEAKQFT